MNWTSYALDRLDNTKDTNYPKSFTYASKNPQPTHTINTFNDSALFLYIGGGAAVASIGIELMVIICCKNAGKLIKGLLFLISAVSVALLMASFFSFYYYLPRSLSADKWCSSLLSLGPLSAYTDTQLMCAGFSGTFEDTRIPGDKITWNFGPSTGWWLMLGAWISSLLASITICATHVRK